VLPGCKQSKSCSESYCATRVASAAKGKKEEKTNATASLIRF